MRHYPIYPKRHSQILDGIWDFSWLGRESTFDEIRPETLVFNETSAVPGVFDTSINRSGHRGIGVYRRKVCFEAGTGSMLRLIIGGLGLLGRIWWDGKRVGDYNLPYSSIIYDFPAGCGKEHELVIAVDNRFDKEKMPLFLPNFDFYAYGGIYRSVELQELPEFYFERVRVETLDIKSGTVRLTLRMGGKLPRVLDLAVSFDSKTPKHFHQKIAGNTITLDLTVPDFKIWSPADPALHTVTVSMPGDSIVERFGIRAIEARNRKILLNGEPLYLRGVNRHESHPEFGPAQHPHLINDDLQILRDMGCNFVRCAHYPQDQLFLDLCDQAGLLVWQESLGWGHDEADALNKRFFEMQVRQTRLMVQNSMNHPSVILWGFLNECCSDTPGGRKLYGALAGIIREELPSALVTYASNRMERDLCFDLADVISINMYPGWIEGIVDSTTPTSAQIRDFINEKAAFADRPGLADKPLVVSEIGACALYGCHDPANAQWSEEFQADYCAESCRCIMDNPRYSGIMLWQMFDTRSYVNAGHVRTKPRGFNCAGLLDEYRRPKQAYKVIQEIFRSFDVYKETG